MWINEYREFVRVRDVHNTGTSIPEGPRPHRELIRGVVEGRLEMGVLEAQGCSICRGEDEHRWQMQSQSPVYCRGKVCVC